MAHLVDGLTEGEMDNKNSVQITVNLGQNIRLPDFSLSLVAC